MGNDVPSILVNPTRGKGGGWEERKKVSVFGPD